MNHDPLERLLSYVFYKDGGWIRVGSLLLHWKCSPPLFSERHGYKKYYRLPFTKWRLRMDWERRT